MFRTETNNIWLWGGKLFNCCCYFRILDYGGSNKNSIYYCFYCCKRGGPLPLPCLWEVILYSQCLSKKGPHQCWVCNLQNHHCFLSALPSFLFSFLIFILFYFLLILILFFKMYLMLSILHSQCLLYVYYMPLALLHFTPHNYHKPSK